MSYFKNEKIPPSDAAFLNFCAQKPKPDAGKSAYIIRSFFSEIFFDFLFTSKVVCIMERFKKV
jgi:hypothetical protein